MASDLSSDDDSDRRSDRFETYSLSADVSESESSCSSTCTLSELVASTSLSSSGLGSTSDFLGPPPILFPVVNGRHVIIPTRKPVVKEETELSEIDLMKERFTKLLLGEDMSGGGKGACTALAISNAITNLAATVFGELWKLEPLAPQKKSMWRREMEWLLCVSDSIVELVPSSQELTGIEIMMAQPRSDLYVNLPALKKLDAMLISILDGFHDSEFYYVDRGVVVADGDELEAAFPSSQSSGRPSIRLEEKWWLPFPKVPETGLSYGTRKHLQHCRECTNQIFKAALAINSSVLSEMEVPNVYLENLPKNGRSCLGDTLYRYITADQFFPECLLNYMDISSEYTTLEIANRIEAAVHIWRQKYQNEKQNHSKPGRSSWGGAVKGLLGDAEKYKLFAERAETLLKSLKQYFPDLPQTDLDMSKIQYNKDVGHSILESYSRVMESLAFNLMARIDDLIYIDDTTRKISSAESVSTLCQRRWTEDQLPSQVQVSSNPFSVQVNPLYQDNQSSQNQSQDLEAQGKQAPVKY